MIPLLEVVGKTGAVAPEQIAANEAKVGVTVGVTVTVADPVFPVPVPPPATDTILYVEVAVGLTAMLTGLAPEAV